MYKFKSLISKLGVNLNSGYMKEFWGFLIGYCITSLLSFITISLVNKNLSPEDLGEYSYLKSIFELLFGILSLSIYSSYLRFNINNKNKQLRKRVLFVVSIATFILSLIILYTTKCFLCILFAAIIIYNERTYYFRSLLDIKQLNWSRIAPASLTLCVILFIIIIDINYLNYKTIFIAYGLGYIIVVFLYKEKNYAESQKTISTKKILSYCIPIVGLILVDWILNLYALILIKKYFTLSELANYAVAQRSILVIKLFSGIFLMFYPMIYFREMEKKNRHFINKSRIIILSIIFLMILIFYIGSEYVYIIMGARKYLEHMFIFQILLLTEFFRVASTLISLYLSFKIQTFKNLIIITVGAIFNIVLLILFLKKFGVEFAAYTSLVSYIMIFLLYIFFSLKAEKYFFKE